MKKLDHLEDIAQNYDLFIIDLWGVVHNGVAPFRGAMRAIEELHKNKKKYFFLTNAPRPVTDVKNFLIKNMRIPEQFLKNIVSSGEAAINSIKNFNYGKYFFHLGPERDGTIYAGLENFKTDLKTCDYILCTGLYDNMMDDLKFYEKLLKNSLNKKMVCTNPDLIVDRGNIQEYCAGTIAHTFEKMGGQVVYFGKPYKEIYKLILEDKKKPLIIGDNLRTDIKGANLLNQDSLFITNGVHKKEIQKANNISQILEKYGVKTNFLQNELSW